MVIGILQPHIPHYREEFFKGIQEVYSCDLLCYQDQKHSQKYNFKDANVNKINIKSIQKYGFLWYNPFVFKKYDVLVLMLNFGHLATWFILLTKFIHRKKIIIWGQGISVKRYIKEEKKPSFFLKTMIRLSDHVWFYTQKELEQWGKIFPKNKNMISLDNTISGVSDILKYKSELSLNSLKEKHKIKQERIFIFCARFNNPFRRVDLLVETIQKFDNEKYGFIIIGEGDYKPNFSTYDNVYDYGSVYEKSIKNELFTMADFYFQPGWVGLSVVEALAYGKTVITFRRSLETLQCVEYAYLNKNNSIIINSTEEMLDKIQNIDNLEIEELSNGAKAYVSRFLTMDQMIKNVVNSLNKIV
jgi:hypothetical protein